MNWYEKIQPLTHQRPQVLGRAALGLFMPSQDSLMSSLSWVTILSTQLTMEKLIKAQGEQDKYSEG